LVSHNDKPLGCLLTVETVYNSGLPVSIGYRK
jgi:hypothetical protein